MSKVESGRVQAQLSLEKALEFAGDNSSYQKQQLLLLALPALALAVLTLKMAFLPTPALLLFLALSAAGQFFLPLYTYLPSSALAMSASALLAALTYPFSPFLATLAFCGMGFFGRGLFAGTLLHLNEVGGERFRAWSMLVVFALWGGASLLASLEGMGVPAWVWVYGLVILPTLVGTYMFLPKWRPTPVWLAARGKYEQARQVLNEIAAINGRPQLPYALEGEQTREGQEAEYEWGAEKWGVLLGPALRGITLRVLAVWVLREYVYFGSLLLLTGLGQDYSKNFILVSISETVAVLMSYPLRLKIRRVNAFLGLTIAVCLASAVASFAVVSEECREKGEVCGAKSVQRIGLMIIRFAIALLGNLLVSYTLQVYPVEVRHTALGMCVGASGVGSLLLQWINAAIMGLGLSGFIPFTFAALLAIYFILQLGETYGRMNNQKLAQLQNKIPLLSLQNWTALNL